MSEPKDPLAFDFGLGFQSASDRLAGEKAERIEDGKNELPFHHGFLDDILRGILRTDLIVLGAETGAGKTEFARAIAARNAKRGKHVYYFALEAENREIERRTKFGIIVSLLNRDNRPRKHEVNYPDWRRGRCEEIIGPEIDAQADRLLALEYKTLHTYYRGSKFDHEDIRKLFLAIQSDADLIILDHLHYVDIEDENENRGFKKTVKMIRDVALGIGRPVILVVHLRKRDVRSKMIVPEIEMVHGSSDIAKICTGAVMLAPARSMPHRDLSISNTLFYVPKDRLGGQTGMVALCEFDRRARMYDRQYTLGRMSPAGDSFEPLDVLPNWAKNARKPTPTYAAFPGEVS